jgi:DNA-binding protein HU-beta
MNKTQLVDALAERLGDRRTAATALDGLLETIVDTVRAGDPVSLAGFGVFESRARAARTARNPRTGEAVDAPATTVPAFRPGTAFRSAVGEGGSPARATPARRSAAAAEVSAEPAEAPTGKKAASDGTFSAPPAEEAGKAGGKSGKSGGKAGKSGGKAGKAASGKNGKPKANDKGKKGRVKAKK